jgi:hypothetical protein
MKLVRIMCFLVILRNITSTLNQTKLKSLLKEVQKLEKIENSKNSKKGEKKQRELFLPYYYNPMMMNPAISTHLATETSTVPPYKTTHRVVHHQNPLAADPYMTNPYFSPFYHGISPFTGFTHFNPFLMPGGPMGLNPLYSGMLGMQYMGNTPFSNGYAQGFEKSNVVGGNNEDGGDDTRKLSLDVQDTLGLPGHLSEQLQNKLNTQQALEEEELNQQLAGLHGISKEDYKDFKKLENEVEEDQEVNEGKKDSETKI